MDKLRAKPEQEPFLGTAEIIRRVRAAQRRPMGSWLPGMWATSLAALAVVALGVGAMAGLLLLRDESARGKRGDSRDLPTAASTGGPGAGPMAPARAKSAPSAHRPEPAAGHRGAASATRAYEVQVRIKDHVGTVWVDGGEVSHGARAWHGPLAVGHHQLAVRAMGQMMRHKFEVSHGDLTITVDPAHARVLVRGAQGGHSADRSP